MKRLASLALFSFGLTGAILGQQADSAKAESSGCQIPAPVKVYTPGPELSAPQLQPITIRVADAASCKKKSRGKVKVFVIVDDKGMARNQYVMDPKGNGLDSLALQIVGVDRFQPGTYNGEPVPVARSLEIEMEGCILDSKDENGKKDSKIALSGQPIQTLKSPPWPVDSAYLVDGESQPHSNDGTRELHLVGKNGDGKNVSAPVPLLAPEAEFSAQARDARFGGVVIVGMVVDVDGNPQKLHIVRPLGMGLDEKALEAVCQYKFKPAMLNGKTPVPVRVNVEVNFRYR